MEIEKRRSEEEEEVFGGVHIIHSQAQTKLEVGRFLDNIHSAYLLCEALTCHNGSI